RMGFGSGGGGQRGERGERGDRGGRGPSGSQERGSPDRPQTRNVYVLKAPVTPNGKPELQRVEIKTGITDGTTTEVVDGLGEGAKVVTAVLSQDTNTRGPAANPFGGGFRRF